MPIRRAYTFTGRVQGVGFRATAQAVAQNRHVTGWVRNETDGAVRLEAQGEPDDIDDFIAAIRELMADNIREADVAEVQTVSGEDGFSIRY